MNYQRKTMKKYLALITVFAALCACEKAQENGFEMVVGDYTASDASLLLFGSPRILQEIFQFPPVR